MRIAYLVTAYRDLRQLERLCAALRREDPGCVVRVQFDCGSPLAPSADRLGSHVVLTDEPIRWGDGTYVRALVASMAALLAEPWDWMVILSGQDHPVRPLSLLHDKLQSEGRSAYVLTSGRWPGDEVQPELVQRYGFRYRWARRPWPRFLRALARRSGPLVERLSGHRLRVQPRPRGDGPGLGVRQRSTIFSEARPCWMGSDYLAMRREAATGVLETLRREPELLEYFANTFVPSEALFASMLRWIDPGAVADQGLHFMRFGGRTNPRPLLEEDLSEVWHSGAFFARKFHDSSLWVEQRLPLHGPPS